MTLILLLLRLALAPVPAPAQTDVPPEELQASESCLIATRFIQGQEQRFYRSVIFGQKPAENARSGNVRYDQTGNAWLKTAENTWLSMSPGLESASLSDDGMDGAAEFPNRRGILETRKALTSELIEPITQSLRALRCRLLTSCYAAQDSDRALAGESIIVDAPGCLPVEIAPITACIIPNEAVIQETIRACYIDAKSLITREAAVIEAVIAYDAAYRSLAQFAGVFNGLFTDMRDPLLVPLQTAIRVLSKLQNIPCFLSQCNE